MIPSSFVMPKDTTLQKLLIENAKTVATGKCVNCDYCPLYKRYNNGKDCLVTWGDISQEKTRNKIFEFIQRYETLQLEFVFEEE